MRTAEITLIGALVWILTTLLGAYIEKEYKVTDSIESTIDMNSTKVYPKIILTDKE